MPLENGVSLRPKLFSQRYNCCVPKKLSVTEAILLSAGMSNRVGSVNKLFLRYQGKALVEHALSALSIDLIESITVVTGHESELIEEILSDVGVALKHNPNYDSGMVSSIQMGIEELDNGCEQFLIALGDMPYLKPCNVRDLLSFVDLIRAKQDRYIVRPTIGDQKGHPVVFSSNFKHEILNCNYKNSLQSIIKKNQQCFFPFVKSDRAFYNDIDTIDQYQNLINE